MYVVVVLGKATGVIVVFVDCGVVDDDGFDVGCIVVCAHCDFVGIVVSAGICVVRGVRCVVVVVVVTGIVRVADVVVDIVVTIYVGGVVVDGVVLAVVVCVIVSCCCD